jgi:hypothetical protein
MIYCKLTLAHCIFTDNVINNFTIVPQEVKDLPIYQTGCCITIYESVQAATQGYATIFKNVYFGGNRRSSVEEDFDSCFYLQAEDIYYQGPSPKILGTVESTGDDLFQFYLSGFGDLDGFKQNVPVLSWEEKQYEPLEYKVNYQYQPLLPSLVDIDQSFSYLSQNQIDATGNYGFVTIKNCEIEDSYIASSDRFDDSTSVVHIDLNNGGYVLFDHATFTKCKTTSSVVDIINAKGVSIVDCSFSRNVARYSSGLLIADVPKVRVCHSSFEKNFAYNNGALTLYRVSDALVINSKFRKNSGLVGPSAIVMEDTTLSINSTKFLRNNNDVMASIVPKDFTKYEQNETLAEHKLIKGVKFHQNISATLGAYGQSKLSLDNVAFNDNEDESGIGSEFFNLVSYDGYADPTVEISVEYSCTDNKRLNFNYNWSSQLKYDAKKCDLYKKMYDYREYILPANKSHETYDFIKHNSDYQIIKVNSNAVVYDVDKRIDVESSIVFVQPPPKPTPYPAPAPIKEGLAPYKTALISVGSICFVVIVVGVAIIYKYRKKPENRLKKKTPEQKAVMDGLMTKKQEEEGDYMAQVDEPPAINTQDV